MIALLRNCGRLFASVAAALGERLEALRAGWVAFWFGTADPLMLGVIRIGTGLVFLWMLLMTGPLLPTLYGPEGWVDQETARILREETPYVPPHPEWEPTVGPDLRQGIPYRPELGQGEQAAAYFRRWGLSPVYVYLMGKPQFSPFFHLRDPLSILLFHVASIAIVVLFTLGLGSRVVSVLAWVVALFYIHRVSASLFGMDALLAVLLLYLAIGPCSDALSLDRWLTLRRRRAAGLPIEPPAPSVSANLALRLMQVHLCFICFAAGWNKLAGPTWWSGMAVWQVMANYEVTPERFAGYTSLLHGLAANRLVWELVSSGACLFVLLVEVGLPFLVWYRGWRGVMLAGLVLVYVGAGLAMGLLSVSVLMMLLASSFLATMGHQEGQDR